MADYEVEQNNNKQAKQSDNSKTGMGVLLGLIGLIGLIIGLVMYKEDTYERKTFIKGWLWCFFISLGLEIIVGILIFAIGINGVTEVAKNASNSAFLLR